MNSMIFLVFLQAFVGFVCAAPLAARDVWDPPVTSPTSGTVWNVGETQTVTWDTSSPPSEVTSYSGQLVLGYMDPNSAGEHLNLDSPLASGFNLTDGKVSFTVPDVPTRSTYIVVLFGDSGNASPEFTINGGSASSSSSASSSESATPTTSTASPSPTSSASAVPTTSSSTVDVSSTDLPESTVVSFTLAAPSSASSSAPQVTQSGAQANTSSPASSAAWKAHDLSVLFISSIGALALSVLVLV
ncbi:hypothetical protein OE88DRAFT_1657453 [Heliocybe sulcata]|uniref:Yeast cell wall synthesis Kre9/Knh1-like N-terminal domain-containing protein n=1 Tax=Heliocybe sulcata TaxID=5364 RepID=A0A5C3N8L1_9AGAM|nr:hypothetical protein OE88DRAFT_1657453 [Heliocybe sulcata]